MKIINILIERIKDSFNHTEKNLPHVATCERTIEKQYALKLAKTEYPDGTTKHYL